MADEFPRLWAEAGLFRADTEAVLGLGGLSAELLADEFAPE
jgi:hypothetical protein